MMCATKPTLQKPVKDPARLEWHEAGLPKSWRRQVTKVAHYYLSVDALSACGDAQAGMTRPMQVREDLPPYGRQND